MSTMRTLGAWGSLALFAVACGPGPIDNSEWTLAVTPAAVVHERPFVAPGDPSRERNRVELIPEWTASDIAPDRRFPQAADPKGVIFRARRAAVDRLGRTWIMDFGDSQLKVFDDAGRFVMSMGGNGQGPAEFGSLARVVTCAGDHVIVSDDSNSRLSFWTLDGHHLHNVRVSAGSGPIRGYAELYGFSDGTFAGAYAERRSSDTRSPLGDLSTVWVFKRFAADGAVLGTYAESPTFHVSANVDGTRRQVFSALAPVPGMAATKNGDIYITSADKYQILAFTKEGELRWALRVDWVNLPYPENEADRAANAIGAMARAIGEGPTIDSSSIFIPSHAPAIAQLRVDEMGRLYVFPWVRRWNASEPDFDEWRPVDVYSREGELLFNGQIAARFAIHDDYSPAWMGVHEGSIRGLEIDPDTQELRLASYRLRLPAVPRTNPGGQ